MDEPTKQKQRERASLEKRGLQKEPDVNELRHDALCRRMESDCWRDVGSAIRGEL